MRLTIDPVEFRGFRYETGVSVTVYAPGRHEELGRGGRYLCGETEPATGLTLFPDAILRVAPSRQARPRVFVPFGADPVVAAACGRTATRRSPPWSRLAPIRRTTLPRPRGSAAPISCAPARPRLYRPRGEQMANVAVIGAQWGDEGKGKVVDWLASRADIVVRFQGGHNAGHTLVVGNETYKLSLLPSGLVRGKLGIIGNGVVVDPEALLAEIAKVRAQGLDRDARHAAHRRERDADPAAAPGDRPGPRGGARRPQDRHHRPRHRPGLRGQGGAPRHPRRRPGRAGDLVATSSTSCCCTTTRCCTGLARRAVRQAELLDRLLALAPHVLPFAEPVWERLDEARRAGKRILFEGAQAVMLDVDHGTYPFVTSSNTVAATAAAGSGIGPGAVGFVLGIAKAYYHAGRLRPVPDRAARRHRPVARRSRA